MRRVIIIFLFLTTILGCSSIRKSLITVPVDNINNITDINDITKNNLTRNDFDIQKIEIQYKDRERDESLMANLKFRKPNDFLISLRTKIGLEIARIKITNDSLFIIDQINKTLYYGSNSFLINNYGLRIEFMPLLIGDILIKNRAITKAFQCNENSLLTSNFNNYSINYNVDCDLVKPLETTLNDSYQRETLLNYSYQITSNDKFVPKHVKITSGFLGYEIIMKLDNYQFNPPSKIIFDANDVNESILLDY